MSQLLFLFTKSDIYVDSCYSDLDFFGFTEEEMTGLSVYTRELHRNV